MKTIRLGSRESKLAVIQSELVMEAIRAHHSDMALELVTMKTTGDKILDRTLDKIGGKGLFVPLAEDVDLLRDGEVHDGEGQAAAAAVVGENGLFLQIERALLDAVADAEKLAAQGGGAGFFNLLRDGVDEDAAQVVAGGVEVSFALDGVEAGVVVGQLRFDGRVEQFVRVGGGLEAAENFKAEGGHGAVKKATGSPLRSRPLPGGCAAAGCAVAIC